MTTDYTDVTAAINADADEPDTDVAEETETPPSLVKRVEILRADSETPEVHYCKSVGYFLERGRISFYQPLWPRRGYTHDVRVADAVDIFVEEVPETSVPALDD